MATKVGTLPKKIPSPETGETLTRGVRPFKVTYNGQNITGPAGLLSAGRWRGCACRKRHECRRPCAACAEGESGWHLGKRSGRPEEPTPLSKTRRQWRGFLLMN
jgi:hypothetical protein